MRKKTNLLMTFVGEFVVIIANNVSMTESNSQTGEMVSGNMMTNGFLLDYDDEFLYLGDDDQAINKAVSRKGIASISIYDESSNILNSIPEPPKDKWS